MHYLARVTTDFGDILIFLSPLLFSQLSGPPVSAQSSGESLLLAGHPATQGVSQSSVTDYGYREIHLVLERKINWASRKNWKAGNVGRVLVLQARSSRLDLQP